MQNFDKIVLGIGLIIFGVAIMVGITPITLSGLPAFLLGSVFVLLGAGIAGKHLKKTANRKTTSEDNT